MPQNHRPLAPTGTPAPPKLGPRAGAHNPPPAPAMAPPRRLAVLATVAVIAVGAVAMAANADDGDAVRCVSRWKCVR